MSALLRRVAGLAVLFVVAAGLAAVDTAPADAALGDVAGQDLAYCLDSTLPATDDGSSAAVDIPFPLTFFGTSYERLYVNNNGNVTFDTAHTTFTPSDITTATGIPIIAPFFADVDTRGAGSSPVTYGASPDGSSFCANWANVGYYSGHDDKLNTFQLILTRNDTGAGRGPGDFDIVFNYDDITWETGDASGGSGGFGGTSALAGFSAGTGLPGTFVQLAGSLVHSALVDGGPNSLTAGQQGSTHVGRYVFPVINGVVAGEIGSLTGSVVEDEGGSPVDDAYVQVCSTTILACSYTYTNAAGGYAFAALLAGPYTVRVWPPDDALFAGGATVAVVAGTSTAVSEIRLTGPRGLPAGVALTNVGVSPEGVPTVYYGQELALSLDGCPGIASPTYTVTLADGTVLRDHLALTESPAGHYSASIAPFYPSHGDAVLSTNVPVTCDGDPVVFNVYIDPSGSVTDQYGAPVAGATVTLLRSDTEDGTYAAVPDGSDIMAVSNRTNPDTTDAAGAFAWDVTPGWYKVTATAAGCSTGQTPAMEVPPLQIDLVVKLDCTRAAPAPTAPPAVTGTVQVGQTIGVRPAGWAAPITTTSTVLMRQAGGGPASPVALAAGSYTLTDADAGAVFTAVSTGRRADEVPPNLPSATVSFTPVTATSAAVTVPSAGVKAPPPVGSATSLKVKPKKPTAAKKVTITITVSASVAPTGQVVLTDGKKVLKTVTLVGGKATIKIKLKKGKHKLKASYGGDASVLGSTTKVVKIKIK